MMMMMMMMMVAMAVVMMMMMLMLLMLLMVKMVKMVNMMNMRMRMTLTMKMMMAMTMMMVMIIIIIVIIIIIIIIIILPRLAPHVVHFLEMRWQILRPCCVAVCVRCAHIRVVVSWCYGGGAELQAVDKAKERLQSKIDGENKKMGTLLPGMPSCSCHMLRRVRAV